MSIAGISRGAALRRIALVTLVILPASFAALAAVVTVAATPGPKPTSGQRPSLVLVTLDTTRADHLGAYGAKSGATPNLDRIGRGGVLFERVIAPAPLTLPSHTTIMTGLAPRRHGVRDNAGFRLDGAVPTLATLLAKQGYDTGAVVGAAVLDRGTGIAQGFRLYDDRVRIGERGEFNFEERAASDVLRAARATLAKLKPPFLLWVHFYDPHHPYVPPAPFAARFRAAPYDGEIAFVDEAVGKLLESAGPVAGSGGVVVAIAGDHGESLGEHDEERHDLFVYQATQRVPLMIAGPRIPAGRRIGQTVGLVDLAPTLLDLLGFPIPDRLDGRSVAGAMRVSAGEGPAREKQAHESDPESAYEMESMFPSYSYNWSPPIGLVSGPWSYIAAPRPELYNLATDPGERQNLLAGLAAGSPTVGQAAPAAAAVTKSAPAAAAVTKSAPVRDDAMKAARRLAAELRVRFARDDAAGAFGAPACSKAIESSCPPAARDAAKPPGNEAQPGEPGSAQHADDPGTVSGTASLDPDAAERDEALRALGYVGGSVAPGRRDAPGPHRDCKDGVHIVKNLQRASARMQAGAAGDAVRILEPLVPDDPRNMPLLAMLGSAYLQAGDFDRALATHRKALELRTDYGLAHANLAGALRAKAASIDGASPGVPGHRTSAAGSSSGSAAGSSGGGVNDPATLRDEAAREYDAALRLNPRDSESYFGYAQLELERARPAACKAVLDRALAADAADPDILLLLGKTRAEQGDGPGARAAFERALDIDPRSAEAHEMLGKLEFAAGNAGEAERHYRSALDLAPSAALARTLGSIRLYALTDRKGALAAYRRALALASPGPERDEIAEMVEELVREP